MQLALIKYEYKTLTDIDQEGMGPTDLGAEWIVPLERPEPAAEKPLSHRHKAQHIDEHGDGDAAAHALAEVDVISPAPHAADEVEWQYAGAEP